MKKLDKIDFIYTSSTERLKPIEVYDGRLDRSFLLVFDDINEKEAAKMVVKALQEGIPTHRIVNKIPDFLLHSVDTPTKIVGV